MKYSVQDIASILHIRATGFKNGMISILLTDSRQIFLPSETLFFALSTPNNDGHKFVSELYDLGVRNFVVSKIIAKWDTYTDANFLLVTNTLNALQKIASYHRRRFDIPVIGITGSNGKTVVKEWLYQILSPSFNITHSPRSYNSQIGVPLSVWQLNEKSEIGIFEAGISKSEEMSRLEAVILPNIGIFTNLGHCHQEGFKSMKQKCLEKLELFIHCDVIICEEENSLLEECMEIACLSHKRLTWSRKGSSKSPLQIIKIQKQDLSTHIQFSILDFKAQCIIPFTDDASIENIMHVLATCIYLRLPLNEIISRLPSIEPVAMRLDVRPGKNNCILINDSYNSDINSLRIALDFMTQRAASNEMRKILIFSDIPQSGIPSSELYAIISDLVSQKYIDLLVGIGSDICLQRAAFSDINNYMFETTADFIKSNILDGFHDAVILLKGARSFQFEQIDKLLEVKTHETVLEVNLDAIVHNYNFYKSHLKPETKIICMVKGDGYGAGAIEIAKTLQYHKCDYLAVAVTEEGVALRKNGIKIPIIVLNPEVGGFEELITYNLEPEVYNFRILQAYIREAKMQGIANYPVHLKIDTGMHRLGFTCEDVKPLADLINNQGSIIVRSVFSHLAASESWGFDDFTSQQIESFKQISSSIEQSLSYPISKHILNSAGIERFPEEQMDMVRLGISLYGISASGQNGLENVCTLKTTILHIKEVKAGDTVGYGRKGVIEKNSTIATIRIGYADGISRRLGNGVGTVFVKGQYVPIIGNVCMDLTMIDITGVDVSEGDSVIIYGEAIPITDVATKIETIPYELLTSISSRVKRIYYKE